MRFAIKQLLLGALVSMLFLSGCGLITPKAEDIKSANFGPMPNSDEILKGVKSHMSNRLFDPYSAVYECGAPAKAWANSLGTLYYGYAVASCNINAKNRYGGYVGATPHNFIINSGSVILDGWASVEYL